MNDRDTLQQIEHEVIECRRCERLVAWREEVARVKRRAYRDWDYWGRGVPGFGDPNARILVMGLAPGAHGSNRTGRMFTGDASGDFLYPALHRAGFASQPESSRRDDGLALRDIWITAVCRCAPPENKPTPQEMKDCEGYFRREVACLPHLQGVVALGRVAFDRVLMRFHPQAARRWSSQFRHGGVWQTQDHAPWVIASYHPSRQNTQTGRLTTAMFDHIWALAKDMLV
ncbi:MAG: uracil-DNA glycosylase [Anaerolineae bacterium]|nr:uracil-DNA glycosylase [Anaerolineae bacterium]